MADVKKNNAEVISVFPNKVRISVNDIESFKVEGELLSVGSLNLSPLSRQKMGFLKVENSFPFRYVFVFLSVLKNLLWGPISKRLMKSLSIVKLEISAYPINSFRYTVIIL